MLISLCSPGGIHLNTKTWLHTTACRLQCWTPHCQITRKTGTQSHPLADRLTQDSMSPQSTLDMANPSGEPALASGSALLSRGQTSYTSKPQSPSRPNWDMGLTGPQPCPRALGHPGPHIQLRQKLAHSNSDLTPALGHPGPLSQWSWDPSPPTSRLTPALGHNGCHS